MWRGRKKRYSDDESDEQEEEVTNRKSTLHAKKTAKLKELQQEAPIEASSQRGSTSTLPISILGSSSTEGATLATVTYVDGQPTVTSTSLEQYTAASATGTGEISVTVEPVTVDGQQVFYTKNLFSTEENDTCSPSP